jgi:outer membrane cobalamin receptor
MMRRAAPAILSFFALASAADGARAEGSDDLLGILNESIVTTASQTAETESTAPATSTTIRADDLRRYGIHTIQEAIDFLSLGVSSAGGRSPAGTSDLGSRGVLLPGDSGAHFLLLIDGHAVNEPFFGTARFDRTAGIPLEAVDRIEVIVGPGSVLYGSNAMLGVINVITKDASTLKGIQVVGETEISDYRRAAALGGASFRLFGSKAELTFGAQYWDEYGPDVTVGPQHLAPDTITQRLPRTRRGGPEDGIWGGELSASTYAHVPSGMLRFRVGDTELSLRGGIAKWGMPFGQGDFDDPDNSTRERWLSADLRHHVLLTPDLEVTARLYADSFDHVDQLDRSSGASCPFVGSVTCQYRLLAASRWAGAELQASYNWLADGSLNTLIGFDGRTRFAGSKQDLIDVDTGAPKTASTGIVHETDATFGAYLQQTYTPTRWLGLNAGARLDRDPRFSPVVSPRAAASFGVWRGGTLRAVYSEAFRAPTFDESSFGNLLRARPDGLKPETVRSVEGSLDQRFGAQRVMFGAFRSFWRNLVELRALTFEEALAAVQKGELSLAIPNANQEQYRNATSIESYGFHFLFEGSALTGRFRYGMDLTEAYSRRQDPLSGSRPLPTAPRFYGNARVSYDLGGGFPTLALGGYMLSARPADRAFDGGFSPVPIAPTLVDVRFTASGAVPLVRGLSYRLSLDVMTEDRGAYVIGPVLSAIPENPRPELDPIRAVSATLGLEYRFLD